MRPLTRCLALVLVMLLGACAEEMRAPLADIERARHVSDDTPHLMLITMVSSRTGSGAHTALVVNGSEQVIFDPAGTFSVSALPERGDVHYGATKGWVELFLSYHSRREYYAHTQQVELSREHAELLLRRVKAAGAQPKAFCTIGTSRVLQGVPGFTHLRQTWFPENLRKQMSQIPGVIDRYVRETDEEKALPGQ